MGPTVTRPNYIVGTSGYCFKDWVGPFYPSGSKQKDMFGLYVQRFRMVELNFTFYSMPSVKSLARMADASPPGFEFWVKANQQITHEQMLTPAEPFIDALAPLHESNKLAGVLLQFPQSFHRTVDNRKFLASAIDRFTPLPLAVEFRHVSWEHPSTTEGLRQRQVTLVVPDAPPIRGLYHPPPTATSRTGYLRLHSRNARQWYAGEAQRYDYSYSEAEIREVLSQWAPLEEQVDKVYTLFNNCHRGQAGQNAEAFRRILGQIE